LPDYQKAFDSIPHSWVEKSIELLRMNSKIIRFCKSSVGKWNITASAENRAGNSAITAHSDTRGILQGDALSPLLFCIALIPLTHKLNRADFRYQVQGAERKRSPHMYDLKLLGRSEEDLKNEIKIVKGISKDINMNFGLQSVQKFV
jgi:hypothetical protein